MRSGCADATGTRLHKRAAYYSTLLAIAVVGIGKPSAADDGAIDFDIPAQSLSGALLQFARQARVSIGFTEELTENKMSDGLVGRWQTRAALERLLESTDLTYSMIGDSVVRVVARDPASSTRLAETPPTDASGIADPGEGEAAASPALADDIGVLRTAAIQPTPIEEIVTVGSRIHNARIAGLLPVTIMGSRHIGSIGATSADDLFRSLPSSGNVGFTGIDNYFYGVNDARGDVSSTNLRSLGSGNTLMLLNGRRMVLHPGFQAEGNALVTTVNGNSLSVPAIQRIEVLRDGASSLYGSDAVGGVINTILKDHVEGFEIGVQYGAAEQSQLEDTIIDLQAGWAIGERQRISLFGSYFHRNGLPAEDRRFSRSSDLRPLFENTPFAGDNDLMNTAASSAWGQFKLPGPVRMNGELITTDTGLFHLQPSAFGDCEASLTNQVCIDAGRIDESLRSDNNRYRYVLPDTERRNLFLLFDREISENAEIYSELSWYGARSRHTREPANPLSSHPITIPAHNYWNPFGPLTFADGRPNPNRLPGIDAPPEGMDILINTRVQGSFYRVVDAGPRQVEVENETRRFLLGTRGSAGRWYWDSAFLYADAETEDVTKNRISSTLFQEALTSQYADAYNPFNGGDPATPGHGDATPNPAEVINRFLIDVYRRNESSLGLWDAQLSNASALDLPAGPIGVALGVEVRRERFDEDRDPRLDGTIGFTDSISGATYGSDVMQSSATPDSSGSREVRSAFAELALPLISPDMEIPFARNLHVQMALRHEHFSDVGETLKPRIAMAWQIIPSLTLRASYAEGFRAPNLPQVNAGAVPRIQVVRDWYRCQALVNTGRIESLGACFLEASRAVEVVTSGSDSLVPEESENRSIGLIWQPKAVDNLTLTIDHWNIEQDGIVGLFGAANHVALDHANRIGGGSNPVVVRADLQPEDIDLFANSGLPPAGLLTQIQDSYVNLDGRITRGVDFSALYELNTDRAGDWHFSLEATHLLAARQKIPTPGVPIAELAEPAIPVVGAGDLIERNGRPRWRASGLVGWQSGNWSAGFRADYIGSTLDTSAIQDQTNRFLNVDDWTTADLHVDYRFASDDRIGTRIRIGARNMFDRDPPLADENLGYFAGLHNGLGRYWYLSLSTGLGTP